ncbi:hypothetical protein CEXT_732411 [Caerostris extrusa]|uniref:Uncharacterized protein n=1 Tax=Caerostris extrusa TaxID=172846 RepID=A0AAV4XPK5_CAEEX|nr:hypothetical protein CEXT_732411 [Caerostris extrusa]
MILVIAIFSNTEAGMLLSSAMTAWQSTDSEMMGYDTSLTLWLMIPLHLVLKVDILKRVYIVGVKGRYFKVSVNCGCDSTLTLTLRCRMRKCTICRMKAAKNDTSDSHMLLSVIPKQYSSLKTAVFCHGSLTGKIDGLQYCDIIIVVELKDRHHIVSLNQMLWDTEILHWSYKRDDQRYW